MADITIHKNDTLKLDYLLQYLNENNTSKNIEIDSGEGTLKGYTKTESVIYNPEGNTGTTTIKINGQKIKIQVIGIPDNGGYLYNEGENEKFWNEDGGIFTSGGANESDLSFESDRIRINMSDDSSTEKVLRVYPLKKFDMTDYNTIYVSWEQQGDSSSNARNIMGVLKPNDDSDVIEFIQTTNDVYSRRQDSLDISSVNGDGRFYFGGYAGGGGLNRTVDARLYQMWVE